MRLLFLFLLCLCLPGCNTRKEVRKFCVEQEAGQFDSEFRVWCPVLQEDYHISSKYGCSPLGEGISLPISWDGVPPEADYLRVYVIDTTCVYDCDSCCRFLHWALDLPIHQLPVEGVVSIKGVEEGGANDPFVLKYTQLNSNVQKTYAPFCPPKHQTHAIVVQLIAYKKVGIEYRALGRAQSIPLLFSLEHK